MLNELFNFHYILNAIACCLYPVIRAFEPACKLFFENNDDDVCYFDWRDTEILMFTCFVVVVKNRRWKPLSNKEYISNLFIFAKLCNLLLFTRQDFRWGALYTILVLLIFLVFPEPSYKGPDKIKFYRGQALNEELLHNPGTVRLVQFYASWSPACTRMSGLFAQLSMKYANDAFEFGKLDVSRYPVIAEKYKVDQSVRSNNLPTLILFENGKETMRRPVVDTKGKVVKKYIFKAENIISDFNLNEIYEKTKSKQKQPAIKKKD